MPYPLPRTTAQLRLTEQEEAKIKGVGGVAPSSSQAPDTEGSPGKTRSWHWARGWVGPWEAILTLRFLLHACLFHAEGDLRVLVAEQDVCNARGWVARGVQMLAAVSQVWVFMTH